jgi:flagellar FliL protein
VTPDNLLRRLSREKAARERGRETRVKKILMFVTLGLVLAGGGGAGAWWWFHRAEAAAPAAGHEPATAAAPEHDPADSGVLVLEPFLVNLADQDSPRFLRATIRMVVADKEHAEHLAEDEVAKARVRSAILELLTTQKSTDLVTPEGKAALKKNILAATGTILTEAKGVDVLFSEFVVQF